jgi:hypothetical protein
MSKLLTVSKLLTHYKIYSTYSEQFAHTHVSKLLTGSNFLTKPASLTVRSLLMVLVRHI